MGHCYDVTSNVGITHHASMKRMGDLYEGDEQLLVELECDNDRQDSAFADCKLDPSLLDCATVAPMYYFKGHGSDKTLYVPFSIDSVWINPEKFNTSTSILTLKPENINKNSETYSLVSHLFDANGTKCASIVGFKVKKVHSIDSFTNLDLKNKVPDSNNNSISDTQMLENKYERFLLSVVEKITGNVADIEADFFDIGLDSADLLDIASQIEDSFSTELYPTVMFEYNNIKKMATHMADLVDENEPKKTEDNTITRRIKDILFSYTGKEFCVEDEFFAVGMDSSDLLEITSDLENEFKTQIYPSLLFQYTTIESLSKYIESILTTSNDITDAINNTTTSPCLYANKKSFKGVNESPVNNNLSDQKTLIWESGNVKKCTDILNEIYDNATLLDRSINIESLSCYENLIYVTTELREEDSDIENIFERLKIIGKNCNKIKISSIVFINVSDSHMGSDKISMVGAYGISALFKVFAKENNLSYTQVFINDIGYQDRIKLSNLLVDATNKEVVVDNGITIENKLAKIAFGNSKTSIFKQEGVYIILGGTGGIGQYLAKYLIQKYNSTVIIVGRNLDKLNSDPLFNAESIDTYQADISKLPELEGMFEYCLYKYNSINGVFHCAMILEDSLISKMSYKGLISPLLPKYVGAKNLIKSTEKCDLDFICFFSSIQSYICNYGQANYASASRYMDEYVRSIRHTRQHPVFTVNWGYWSDIGAVSSQRYNDIMKR
jgi:acyl carrier protein